MLHIDNSLEENKAIFIREKKIQTTRIFKSVLLLGAIALSGYLLTKPLEYYPNVLFLTHENFNSANNIQEHWIPLIKNVTAILIVGLFINISFCINEISQLEKKYRIIQTKILSKSKPLNLQTHQPKGQTWTVEDKDDLERRLKIAKAAIPSKHRKFRKGDPKLN